MWPAALSLSCSSPPSFHIPLPQREKLGERVNPKTASCITPSPTSPPRGRGVQGNGEEPEKGGEERTRKEAKRSLKEAMNGRGEATASPRPCRGASPSKSVWS